MSLDVREIGPIGTASRAVGGVGVIALAFALGSVTWGDIAVGLVGFPLLATAAVGVILGARTRFAPRTLAGDGAICSGLGCSLLGVVLAAVFGLDVLTPVDGDAAGAVWLGASLILAAVRGYGGCEMLAFPSALTGRPERIGCMLFTPLDAAEARHRPRRQASPTG